MQRFWRREVLLRRGPSAAQATGTWPGSGSPPVRPCRAAALKTGSSCCSAILLARSARASLTCTIRHLIEVKLARRQS